MAPRSAENRPPFARPPRVASGDDAFHRSLVDELGETIAPLSGEALFRSAVRCMSRALGVQAVFVAECVDYPTTRVRILAEWDRGRVLLHRPPRELLARIRALLRRSRAQETVAEGLARIRAYRFAGRELNVRLRRLTTPGGETVALTNSEFNLLAAFLAAPQRVLSRDQLLSLSRLHNDEVYDRSIDVQIGRLRKELEAGGPGQTLIRTERGAGYVFAAAIETVR
ncbi:MAG TPA: winged helix-turn-helix domain-containing protein [Burkholderiales bacterium]|nr:winged helix-turn-helix domain-containing protein [Burkholderiales bacterium]